MNTFAEYMLEEKALNAKIEIAYYLSKKTKIFFDKSVIFKLEIARLFLNCSGIDVDKNFVLTACLLCNCKKVDNAQDINRIHTYAKSGAEYLQKIGFDERFCKVCEEINRYSNSIPREKESDILELVDQFGGMLLDRPERIGFKPDEALVLLEHRNLKGKDNRYLQDFVEFVNFMEKIEMSEMVSMSPLRRLVKIYNETEELPQFIKKVLYDYEPKIDKLISEKNQGEKEAGEVSKEKEGTNIPLFSEETAKKIMAHMHDDQEDGHTDR